MVWRGHNDIMSFPCPRRTLFSANLCSQKRPWSKRINYPLYTVVLSISRVHKIINFVPNMCSNFCPRTKYTNTVYFQLRMEFLSYRYGFIVRTFGMFHSIHIIGLPDSLISTYIAQYMGFAIGRIHYGLKVVFCFRHITASHYHHGARQLTVTEYI